MYLHPTNLMKTWWEKRLIRKEEEEGDTQTGIKGRKERND